MTGASPGFQVCVWGWGGGGGGWGGGVLDEIKIIEIFGDIICVKSRFHAKS